MKTDKSQHIGNSQLVENYGRVLRKSRNDKIVDLDESLQIVFDFQLHRIDELVQEFDGIMPPNRISHYVLAFITQGSGHKTIGQHRFEIQENMALIFPRKVIHSTNRWSLDTKGYMLTFSTNFFSNEGFPESFLELSSLFKLSTVPHLITTSDISKQIVLVFEELFEFKQSTLNYQSKRIALKVAELVFIYKSLFEPSTEIRNSKSILFDQFSKLVELNFRKEKTVQFYANTLSVHPNHLNFIVKKQLGFPAKIFIKNRLLLEAKYLLKSTSMPVKEIAYDLGFNDYNYFSRYFKTKTKNTPVEYRKLPV